jgi:hypothetical protein
MMGNAIKDGSEGVGFPRRISIHSKESDVPIYLIVSASISGSKQQSNENAVYLRYFTKRPEELQKVCICTGKS